LIDQLPRVFDLFAGQFPLASKLHTSALRRLYTRASAFDDEATLKLGKNANYLPHRPTGGRGCVNRFCQRLKTDSTVAKLIEQGYQIT